MLCRNGVLESIAFIVREDTNYQKFFDVLRNYVSIIKPIKFKVTRYSILKGFSIFNFVSRTRIE